MHVNPCFTVKKVGGVSSNKGRRLGESEVINSIFAIFSVVDRNRTALVRELLSINHRLEDSCNVVQVTIAVVI